MTTLARRSLDRLSHRGWLPNIVLTLVALLAGPAIGGIMSKPRLAVYGLAAGITILIWVIAHAVAQSIDSQTPVAATPPPPLAETTRSPTPPPSEESLAQAAVPTPTPTPAVAVSGDVQGSVIVSQGQIGGQIAHEITNMAPPTRTLSPQAIEAISERLKSLPSHAFEIEAVHGDSEARNLAFQISEALQRAGWSNTAFASSLFPRPIVGLEMAVPAETEEIATLIELLRKAGLTPRVTVSTGLQEVRIVVGSRE